MTKNIGGYSRHRRTVQINRKTTQSIFRAFDFAKHIGHQFNLYVVININSEKIDSATFSEKLRHKFRDWLTYKMSIKAIEKTPPLYAWTMENPRGHLHVNWVVYVPPILIEEFRKKVFNWVQKIQGEVGSFDIDVQSMKGRGYKSLANYVVKGTDPYYWDHFHLTNVGAPQGEVIGKRAGFSAALGPTARREAGFTKPKRSHRWHYHP